MYIGLDVGGTKILGGAFEKDTLISTHKVKTNTGGDGQVIAQQIVEVIQTLADSKPIEGIGLGIPGNINRNTGIIEFSPNLPFNQFPMRDILKKSFDVPIDMGNDVNVGMLGEHWMGAAKNVQNAVGIFIGTGIGGALILNNALYHGTHHIAGEIGHMKLKLDGPACNCGEQGCFEALASKIAIQRALEKNGLSFNGMMKSSFLKEQLAKNNKVVKAQMKKVATYIGEAIGSLANVLDPEVFVLGGGVIEAIGPDLLKRIKPVAKSRALMPPTIKLSTLGDHALLYGAVRLVSQPIA
ncbi:ROK family protein [Candidatus Magnetaquicoccus inordinatus]|uniref:ROK family protein n=1 Tax=Candidatus Magnetaquicoccus inordinatus TaxID=2496818 RepID=UPI00102C8B1B|nr:ROK family protein [Candidatus Magnetaquicoccus inordinatus]